jgi:hypothetical protein
MLFGARLALFASSAIFTRLVVRVLISARYDLFRRLAIYKDSAHYVIAAMSPHGRRASHGMMGGGGRNQGSFRVQHARC